MRKGKDGIQPSRPDQRLRLERQHNLGVPPPERAVLFSGPRGLLATVQWMANGRQTPPELLQCHPDDYRAAGLDRNGPMTWLAIMPPLASIRAIPSEAFAATTVRKCALEPDPTCPRGEVRVVRR